MVNSNACCDFSQIQAFASDSMTTIHTGGRSWHSYDILQEIFEPRMLAQSSTVCDVDRKRGLFKSDQCCAAQADLISSACFHARFDLLKSDLLYFIKDKWTPYASVSRPYQLSCFWGCFDGYRKPKATQRRSILLPPSRHWPTIACRNVASTEWNTVVQTEHITGKSYSVNAY